MNITMVSREESSYVGAEVTPPSPTPPILGPKTEKNREEDPLRYKGMKHMKTGFGDRHQGLILAINYIALVDFFISLSFSLFIK